MPRNVPRAAAAAPVRPVFVDHSSDRGGAEFALARLLRTRQEWAAALVVPASADLRDDVFADLPPEVEARRVGPTHTSLTTSEHRRRALLVLAWRLLLSTVTLWSTDVRRRGNVLVANTTRASVYVTVVGTLTRMPVVVHIRDMVEAEALGSTATSLMRKLVLPRAAAVIANSRAALEKVQPYLSPTCRSEVIPSPSGLQPVDPAHVNVSATPARIGIVARLDPWKGQDLLIRAFARAFPDTPTRLVLFGGAAFGHEAFAEQLRALAEECGVGGRVEFVGHVDDVPAAIGSLDVCVQCSVRPEPLGQNVLQYLAAGKPTIVADEGGPAEWVTDGSNGLIFRARDADALAAALTRIGSDPALRHRVAATAPRTEGLATDQQIGARIAALLEEVVSR